MRGKLGDPLYRSLAANIDEDLCPLGVIRKMKKSGKYALNTDVFDSKSRPVSVASVHDHDQTGGSRLSNFYSNRICIRKIF